MTNNLSLWSSVEKTDPSQTKAITGKPYKGTSPKPYHIVHKATETFGPCGIGWGFRIVRERVEDGAAGDKVHIAHIAVWYEWGGKRGEVEHVGQTMFSGKRNDGKTYTDEDAPKKSVTDALVKALSMIGFAGDIFMGRYDDSKYVAELREEIAEQNRAPSAAETYVERCKGVIASCNSSQELRDWWNREAGMRGQLFAGNSDPDFQVLVGIYQTRGKALVAKENTVGKEAAE